MSIKPYFGSSSSVWSDIKWVYGIEEAGYTGWEISADGNYRLDKPEVAARVREVIETTGLEVSVHAPFADLNLASINDAIYRESIRQIMLVTEASAAFTDQVTIHPGYLSPAGKLVPQKVWGLHKAALVEIGRVSEDCGVSVTLENMPNIPDFFCRYCGELSGMVDGVDGIGCTFDFGHANTMKEIDAFLGDLSSASHIHVHDNHGKSDEHLALGDGLMDWKKIGHAIATKYSGRVVIEGRNIEEAAKSLQVFQEVFR